jgi:hypothetical protein
MTGRERFLTGYSGVLTAAVAIAVFAGFAPSRRDSFDRLKVQRIDIVEPDGTLRMVISDHAHLPGMIVRGKESAMPRPQAGMLFYNDEGTENGGLIFGGRKNEKGEVVDSGGSLSFDKYGTNQIVQLVGVDDKEDRFAGLAVVDSPTGADTRRRAWVGRREDGTASVELRDGEGRKRLVLSVGAAGETSLAFLDATGKVVRKLTPETVGETR